MKKLLLLLFVLPLALQAKIITEEITYKVGNDNFKGLLAYPDSKGLSRPGVLVVHEWWGLNDYAKKRAKQLAQLGYSALALDMYGEGKTAGHPKDAGKFSSEVKKNMPEAVKRFKAAMKLLQQRPDVDPKKIAAIGYCFGGSIVLEMAARGLALKAVASFHGSLGGIMAPKKGAVRAKVFVANGAADQFIKPEHIKTFKENMDKAQANYTFINYPDALHSFTNPGADAAAKKFKLSVGYNKTADEKSWAKMRELFEQVF